MLRPAFWLRLSQDSGWTFQACLPPYLTLLQPLGRWLLQFLPSSLFEYFLREPNMMLQVMENTVKWMRKVDRQQVFRARFSAITAPGIRGAMVSLSDCAAVLQTANCLWGAKNPLNLPLSVQSS